MTKEVWLHLEELTHSDVISIGQHQKSVHLLGHGHVVPPPAGVVRVEELIIGAVDHHLGQDELVAEREGVDDGGELIKLGMIKVLG